MAQILDGKLVARKRAEKLKEKVKVLKKDDIFPKFCVINIGNDLASQTYLKTKKLLANKIGIEQINYQFSENTSEDEVIALIKKLNHDNSIYGIMVQLPVPDKFDVNKLLDTIDPAKDVDGLTSSNVGALWKGNNFVEPATAIGIINLLDYYHIDLTGQNFVIIGRSNIVGKPLAALALEKNATISILHHLTKNIDSYTKNADIVVCATGQAGFLSKNMIKPGAIVIDVGINRSGGKVVGDVLFDEVSKKASWITPVPGGVGPLTVEHLMEQVVRLTRRANGR